MYYVKAWFMITIQNTFYREHFILEIIFFVYNKNQDTFIE